MVETFKQESISDKPQWLRSDGNNGQAVEPPQLSWHSMPPWADLLARDSLQWQAARAAAKRGPRVLITNAFGIDPSVINLNSMLALALTLRGADVHLLLCDQALPACWVSQIERVEAEEFAATGPQRRVCEQCFPGVNWVFQSLGLPVHRQSELVLEHELKQAMDLSSSLSVEQIGTYRLDGMAVGEHALAGALRFFARGDLEGEPYGEVIVQRYFNAALQSVFATRRLMTTFQFSSVVSSHGMYVPEGLITEAARKHQARVVTWSFGYRKRTCIFSHEGTYHHTLLTEPSSHWESIRWTDEMETEILTYLNSRRYGTRDWIRFIEDPQEDVNAIKQELGFDFSKPAIALLTNVVWDAQLTYRNNAFDNMMEWIVESIRYFARRPELQLIIRVHPGELLAHTRARQTVIGEIRRVIPDFPANVVIIPPESKISTYTVASLCNAALIYGTKTGVELTSMGIPVLVAGEAWIRNKGVTLDANSPRQYFQLLDQLPLQHGLSHGDTERARKYAYHFFYRRMVPLPFTSDGDTEPDVHRLIDLEPGRNPGLDVICDGILHGSEFIYPAERYPVSPEEDTHVSEEALAYGSFRIADGLGHAGEHGRMRTQLLTSLANFPTAVEKPWGRAVIARNVQRLALAAQNPLSAAKDFLQETKTLPVNKPVVHRAVGDGLTEAAVVLWKKGAYVTAVRTALSALYHHPKQFFQQKYFQRLLGALFRYCTEGSAEKGGSRFNSLLALFFG